jgi:hypothetical protein
MRAGLVGAEATGPYLRDDAREDRVCALQMIDGFAVHPCKLTTRALPGTEHGPCNAALRARRLARDRDAADAVATV